MLFLFLKSNVFINRYQFCPFSFNCLSSQARPLNPQCPLPFALLVCWRLWRKTSAVFIQNSGWPKFWEALFGPQPEFFALTQIDQVSQGESHNLHHCFPSLRALSFICCLSVLTTSQLEQNRRVNQPSLPLNTLLHSKRDNRKGELLY